MANEYDSWTGAAEITGIKIFEGNTKKELELTKYPDIAQYLPPTPETSTAHYFIGRVATKSKKVAGQDVVKLFPNASWDKRVVAEFENLEFVKVGTNLSHLMSDRPIQLDADPSQTWQAWGRVEIFRDLNPPGRPTARIVFKEHVDGEETGRFVSAFWCWP